MDLDLQEYMGAYIDGSRENLDTMDKMLLNLEQNPNNLEAIEEIFRAAHTLKGMSATMGFEKVAHLTHEMENILDKLRNHLIAVSSEVIDVIFETFDVLRTLVNDTITQTDSQVDLNGISEKLAAIGQGQSFASQAQDSEVQPVAADQAVSSVTSVTSVTAVSGISAELADMDISDFETGGLLDAVHGGKHAYLMKVNLVTDCLLKGPRVFMVLRNLDSLQAEIIKAKPEVKDLENEKFENSFKMLLVTASSAQEINQSIESISEIETVEVIPLDQESLKGGPAIGASTPDPPPPPQPQPQQQTPPAPAPVPVARQAPVVSPPQHVQPSASHFTPSQQSAPSVQPAQPQVQAVPAQDFDFTGMTPAASDESQFFEDETVRETIEIVQMVSFMMAGETYALEIHQVRSIMNMVPITRVPKAPKHIEGVINLRGEILPVINLRKRLKLPQESDKIAQIIILAFDEEKVKVGFMVDQVHEVLRLPATSIEPPSHVTESVDIQHLKGVGKIEIKSGEKTENKIIILLNAHKIVFGTQSDH